MGTHKLQQSKIGLVQIRFNQTSQKFFRPLEICLINKKSIPMHISTNQENKSDCNFFNRSSLLVGSICD